MDNIYPLLEIPFLSSAWLIKLIFNYVDEIGILLVNKTK